MTYDIGKHHYNTKAEYEAAQRDVLKISGIKKHGDTPKEIAASAMAQIKKRNLTFETNIGKDYLNQVKKLAPDPDEPEPQEDIIRDVETLANEKASEKHSNSGSLNVVRKLMLAPLVFFTFVIGLLLFLWIRMEKNSLDDLEALQKQEKAAAGDAEETVSEERVIMPRFTDLSAQNSDLAGWLTIPGTDIDYPVMFRADDNDYYLSHNFNGEEDINGLLVLDKRCDPKDNGVNRLIHGHNMDSGAMFGGLKHFANKAYRDEHPYIEYSSLYETDTYEIFAVFRSSVYNEDTSDFQYFNYIMIDDIDQFNEYVSSVCDQSIYDTGITPVWGDKLITLSTCEYSKENGRLVVVGRHAADE